MPIMEIDPCHSETAGELERKRENRLTNIVDQLLHSKASQSRSEDAKLDRGSHGDDEKSAPVAKLDNKTRRKRVAQQRADIVKDERRSPADFEIGASSARTASPPSPNSASLRTPPSVTSYSPSTMMMMDGLHMSRNYSDFMRSLAAKYNNNNNNNSSSTNDYARFDSTRLFKGSTLGDGTGPSASAAISALAAFPHFSFKEAADDSAKRDGHSFMDAHALPAFPMMDMSSTQALINIVRSSRSGQHADSYLRASTAKRPAADAGGGPIAHSPLDLSAAPVKRACPETVVKSVVEPDSLPAAKKKYFVQCAEDKQLASPDRMKTVHQFKCRSTCAADSCSGAAVEVHAWSVNEVVDFVRAIDLCAEYAEVFREHAIDGSTLPLLTEDHLTASMGMKLGPALKLRSALANRIGHCAVCLHCAHCHGDAATPHQE